MKVKSQVLSALAEARGGVISGACMAQKLGVSRNAVWKAIKALEEEGYAVESHPSSGYRLSKENNRLSEEIISAELETKAFGRKIIVLDETDSTNNYAKKLSASGAEHGTAVIADFQTSGKGRLGRSFVSPKGTGVYMSVIIRPDFSMETARLITSCVACASAEAVESLCGESVDIKWVNDLYMNGRKICGILTEASLSMETKALDYAVIGIGINVLGKDVFDEALSKIATTIEAETAVKISRNSLCAVLLNKLEEYLGKIGERDFLAEYRRREILTGNPITANVGGVQITGKAMGIDDNAELIVQLDDGSVKSLSSGEANLCRIKKN